VNEPDFLQRQSLSPSREKARSPGDRRSPVALPIAKKLKKDEVSKPSAIEPLTDLSLSVIINNLANRLPI
jgi:hypothetical protein